MNKIIFWVTFGVAAILIVVGFIIPPTGVIDGSVLTAVGLLPIAVAGIDIAKMMTIQPVSAYIHM